MLKTRLQGRFHDEDKLFFQLNPSIVVTQSISVLLTRWHCYTSLWMEPLTQLPYPD